MDRKAKIWKAVKIIAVIAAILVLLQYCSDRKEKHRQQAENKAYLLAEAIHDIADYRYSIYDMSYYELQDTLSDIISKCEDLEQTADEVLNEFAEQDIDLDNRRSWWY